MWRQAGRHATLVAAAHPYCSLLSLSVVQSHWENKADIGRQGDMEGEEVFGAQLSLYALKKVFHKTCRDRD